MPQSNPPKTKLDTLLIGTVVLSLILALSRFHLLEKDFLEILNSADGLTQGICYSFLKLNSYLGLNQLTGFTARPPLIPMLLTATFSLFGHKLSSIYVVYFIPRMIIAPCLYLLAKKYLNPTLAYMVAVISIFFPYYDTYAISTLKADVFVVAWSVMATYWAARYIQEKNQKYLLGAGICLGLNALSKETATAFSATLLVILSFYAFSSKHKSQALTCLWLPVVTMISPFVIWSLIKTGRPFPNLYATAVDLSSFPLNIKTYLLSVLYYAGISFNLSKSITIESMIRLGLLLSGVIIIIKKRHAELVLPILAMLVGISLTHTKVIQGDLIGNREILHRIAPAVPFTALIIGLGMQRKNTFLSILVGSAVTTGFFFRYFRAPFALDYTAKEFYVSAAGVFSHQPQLPFTTFTKDGKFCTPAQIPARETISREYLPYKTSPFPSGLKEISLITIILPLLFHWFTQKKYE